VFGVIRVQDATDGTVDVRFSSGDSWATPMTVRAESQNTAAPCIQFEEEDAYRWHVLAGQQPAAATVAGPQTQVLVALGVSESLLESLTSQDVAGHRGGSGGGGGGGGGARSEAAAAAAAKDKTGDDGLCADAASAAADGGAAEGQSTAASARAAQGAALGCAHAASHVAPGAAANQPDATPLEPPRPEGTATLAAASGKDVALFPPATLGTRLLAQSSLLKVCIRRGFPGLCGRQPLLESCAALLASDGCGSGISVCLWTLLMAALQDVTPYLDDAHHSALGVHGGGAGDQARAGGAKRERDEDEVGRATGACKHGRGRGGSGGRGGQGGRGGRGGRVAGDQPAGRDAASGAGGKADGEVTRAAERGGAVKADLSSGEGAVMARAPARIRVGTIAQGNAPRSGAGALDAGAAPRVLCIPELVGLALIRCCTRTHAQTHTHSLAQTQVLNSHSLSISLAHSHTRAHTRAHTCSLFLSPPRSRLARTNSNVCTHTHSKADPSVKFSQRMQVLALVLAPSLYFED